MASQDQSERCKLMSIIRNSTTRRRNRPQAKPNIQASRYPVRSPDNGNYSFSKSSSAFESTSNNSIVQKLARLSQLDIPHIPQSAELLRHPTVLRAGPPTTATPLRSVTSNHWQDLFITPRYSVLPRTTELPDLMRDIPYLSPDQAISPFTIPAPAKAKADIDRHLREIETPADKANTNAELQLLRHAINTLYDSSSLLIPPYLFDRLNQLEVVDNKFDFAFQEYKSEDLTTTVEKLDRVHQFLPILKQVIDLVSATLLKERNSNLREA